MEHMKKKKIYAVTRIYENKESENERNKDTNTEESEKIN